MDDNLSGAPSLEEVERRAPDEMSGASEDGVQGIPRSLLGSLWGTGILLLAVGGVYELYAWDNEGRARWVCFALLIAAPLLALTMHVRRVRKLRQPMVSPYVAVFLAVNALALPFIFYLPSLWLKLIGPFLALGYGFSLLWYGAFYNSLPHMLAACALTLAAVLSIPFCYSLTPALGGLVILAAGASMLALACRLGKLRKSRLAARRQALRKQQLNSEKSAD